MQGMLDAILPKLEHDDPILSITVKAYVYENELADELALIQQSVSDVSIGSYPFDETGTVKGTNLVARSRDPKRLAIAQQLLQALVDSKAS